MSDGMNTVILMNTVLDYECSVDDAITIETMMFKNMRTEIERLTAELAERDEQLLQMQSAAIDLTKQLADSQQECDRLKEELEASDWVGEQACKAIASECIEAIEKQHGVLGLAFTLRQRYGLDG